MKKGIHKFIVLFVTRVKKQKKNIFDMSVPIDHTDKTTYHAFLKALWRLETLPAITHRQDHQVFGRLLKELELKPTDVASTLPHGTECAASSSFSTKTRTKPRCFRSLKQPHC
eukprot:PhM_4_TR17372/c4_g2_i3/m.73078